MNFVSIRVFMFTLIYISILFVKIKALDNINSGSELSANFTEIPRVDSMIVKVPRRQNQPCPTGEKRGHSGKCRKRW
jgi:hypothetical protein